MIEYLKKCDSGNIPEGQQFRWYSTNLAEQPGQYLVQVPDIYIYSPSLLVETIAVRNTQSTPYLQQASPPSYPRETQATYLQDISIFAAFSIDLQGQGKT